MNRETKVGLITGLGVIVLIGVLLSEYLGGGASKDRAARPSDLTKNLGETYRQSMTSPQGVPPMDTRSMAVAAGQPGGTDLTARDLTAYAHSGGGSETTGAGGMGGGLTIGPVVTVVPAGDIPASPRADRSGALDLVPMAGGGGSTPAVYVVPGTTGTPVAAAATTTAPSTNPSYTIAKGDTLTIIAKKFYHSATKADIARLVLANGTMLKDEKTQLVVGKKLVIPPAPQPVVVRNPDPVPTPRTPETPRADARTDVPRPVIIGAPGMGRTDGVRPEPRVDPVVTRIEAPKTYTVQKGDSVEKIARKFLGTASKDAVAKIVALNKISDKDAIKEGMELRIPPKDQTAARSDPTVRVRG